jgi:fumarate reductase subunit D
MMRATTVRRNDFRARGHAAYWAFVVHRVSGIVLTLFLPVHFFVLSQALARPAALDRFLNWTQQPAVKASETLLVLALSAHLAGGVRLLFVEFVGWRRQAQRSWVAVAAGVALFCALAFALNLY